VKLRPPTAIEIEGMLVVALMLAAVVIWVVAR
jgi:hypothetical protein